MLDAVTTNPHHTPHGNPRVAPLVIAHRTTMGRAPENTLLGVRRGLELGVDGIEIDVQLSADGAPVLMHDQLLDRTTSGDGVVGETTLAQLRMLDAGEGERIPTLGETLAAVDGQALLVVELKTSPGDDVEALSEAVLREIDAVDAMPWIWLWSFDPDAVRAVAKRAPPGSRIAHLCLLPGPEIYQACANLQLNGVSMHYTACTAPAVQTCQAQNLASFVWTVNEPTEIERVASLGLTGIVSDYPERVRAAL